MAACSFNSISSYGQAPATGPARQPMPEPLYIINSTIIANGLVAEIDVQAIKNMVVYKGQSIPDELKNMTTTGIIAITYAGRIKSKSFAALGRQYGVRGPRSVVLNGHKLSPEQASTLRLAPEAIGQVLVIPPTADTAETLLTIQLAVSKPASHQYPPGTIMLR
ncbi:hypothetical protein LGH70_07455 [Hymenobacter sp. BT635]|uniref:TonB-dependent receptor plug domain-containing protein n=1 Tax=Hymenobacter nitidus TaxID=2880929 RepID=A0ABS8AAI7_9BACT|nr:hypothetical protein [Hymenobacter nitidus]MCB2377411.1 hypothetical protein [Hymenobacter nitidus]